MDYGMDVQRADDGYVRHRNSYGFRLLPIWFYFIRQMAPTS